MEEWKKSSEIQGQITGMPIVLFNFEGPEMCHTAYKIKQETQKKR